MSTESNLSVCFENSPLGHRYVIHLKSKDEVCLHALTLLQSDSLPCFLPAELNENEDILSIDLAGCIPLSELKGKDKSYVKQHHRQLLSSFLYSLIQSVDHAMDPGGICFLEDQLFYDRKKQKLVAVYLPFGYPPRQWIIFTNVSVMTTIPPHYITSPEDCGMIHEHFSPVSGICLFALLYYLFLIYLFLQR